VVTNMIFNSITDAHDAITHWHIPKCEVSNINSFLLQDVSRNLADYWSISINLPDSC